VQPGDVLPIVDASEITSPTGETKQILVNDFIAYMVSASGYQAPQPIYYSPNALFFDQNIIPNGDVNKYCYGAGPNVGSSFTLAVRGYIPSSYTSASYDRVIFGISNSVSQSVGQNNVAYIGVSNGDLKGYVKDSSNQKQVVHPNFFSQYPDQPFFAAFTKDSSGTCKFYINGQYYASASSGPTSISTSIINVGCGVSSTSGSNLSLGVYEAHIFTSSLSAEQIKGLYYGGLGNSTLVASYKPTNLNPGPSQWLDDAKNHHLLIPESGALATNGGKTFHLRFYATGSTYLGNGTKRDVLPANYVLTDAFVYSQGSPLISIGTSDTVSTYGSTGIDSYNNNRVPLVSASYSKNNLPLLELGLAHVSRSLYVFFSSSAAPCTFSFEGYVSEYGPMSYIVPTMTPTPTKTQTPTPTPTNTPTSTLTPTPTPTNTPTSTTTPGVTSTATSTPTPTPTITRTSTPTPTPTLTTTQGLPSISDSISPSDVGSPSPSDGGSGSPGSPVSETGSPSPSPTGSSPSPSPSPSGGSSPSPSPSPSGASPSPSPSPSGASPSPSPSAASPSPSPSGGSSPSPSPSGGSSPSPSPTGSSPSPSPTGSSPSPSPSPSEPPAPTGISDTFVSDSAFSFTGFISDSPTPMSDTVVSPSDASV
jgi:hypothetical protein